VTDPSVGFTGAPVLATRESVGFTDASVGVTRARLGGMRTSVRPTRARMSLTCAPVGRTGASMSLTCEPVHETRTPVREIGPSVRLMAPRTRVFHRSFRPLPKIDACPAFSFRASGPERPVKG
jgi:hypothetical protein